MKAIILIACLLLAACGGTQGETVYEYQYTDPTFPIEASDAGSTATGETTMGGTNDNLSKSGKLTTGNSDVKLGFQTILPGSGNYTIQFSMEANPYQPPDQRGFTQQRAQAEITWFAGGNSITRRISIVNGASISGVAERVKVVMYDVSFLPTGGGHAGAPFDYAISCQIAKGVRPTTKTPPIYVPTELQNGTNFTGVVAVPSGATVIWDVPPDIGATSVFITAIPSIAGNYPIGSLTVLQESNGSFFEYQSYDPRDYDFVPIFPGTTQIAVGNSDTTPGNEFFVGLVFGIDG